MSGSEVTEEDRSQCKDSVGRPSFYKSDTMHTHTLTFTQSPIQNSAYPLSLTSRKEVGIWMIKRMTSSKSLANKASFSNSHFERVHPRIGVVDNGLRRHLPHPQTLPPQPVSSFRFAISVAICHCPGQRREGKWPVLAMRSFNTKINRFKIHPTPRNFSLVVI